MGLILDVAPDEKVHAEARRESFVLYDDMGKRFSLELEWGDLDDVAAMVAWLAKNPRERLPHLKAAVAALQRQRAVDSSRGAPSAKPSGTGGAT